MQMVMLSSNIPDTPEMRERMGRQVLRSMIDEKLQLQEAKRQNVTATDAEVEKALQQIEKQNNMSTEQLDRASEIARHRPQRAGRSGQGDAASGQSWCAARRRKRSMFPTRRSTKR